MGVYMDLKAIFEAQDPSEERVFGAWSGKVDMRPRPTQVAYTLRPSIQAPVAEPWL